MELELKRIIKEKWIVSPCKCGEEPEIFDRKHNSNNGHERQVVIHCPECGREAISSYQYQYSEVDFLAIRYKAVLQAITKWENL